MFVVFEGLVGLLSSPSVQAKYSTYLRLHRWKQAVRLYEPNELVAKHLWDLTWRYHFTLDCVTWLDERMLDHVEEWIDREGLPFSSIHRHTPTDLSRRMSTMPYLAAIYDPDPRHQLLFGSKARIISPSDPSGMGRF